MREFPVRELHPRIQQGKRVDERTRTADPESNYESVATCSRRWLELGIRLPKLFALALIYPGESAPPQSAAGFVGRHAPVMGTVLDAGAGTGLFGSILRVLGYEDLVGIDISERMLEKAGEKDVYRGLHRMALGEPLGFEGGSFSASVCVGVFATNHAPPEALEELVRVVEPEGWAIFSVRDDVYRKEGFEEKQASLEEEGGWRRVTMSEAFQPFPAGNTSHMSRLFVYKTG
jgi:SAM-dependent methyltransferase